MAQRSKHSRTVACGAGFAGDRVDPAVALAASGLADAVVLECLAERTLVPGLRARASDPSAGADPRLNRRLGKPAAHRARCELPGDLKPWRGQPGLRRSADCRVGRKGQLLRPSGGRPGRRRRDGAQGQDRVENSDRRPDARRARLSRLRGNRRGDRARRRRRRYRADSEFGAVCGRDRSDSCQPSRRARGGDDRRALARMFRTDHRWQFRSHRRRRTFGRRLRRSWLSISDRQPGRFGGDLYA